MRTSPQDRAARWRRYWDKQAAGYDRGMAFWDRVLFRDSRAWVCSQATGDVLEVAAGTGLNLPHYPEAVRLTGVDVSSGMLGIARQRATDLGRDIDLREGDAQALPFDYGSFDTVVCTFGLCAVPDHRRVVDEMIRVLRPAGTLLLADHVAGSRRTARAVQRLFELVTVPTGGEHFLRRPLDVVRDAGLLVERRERFGPAGIVERLAARKPRGSTWNRQPASKGD